MNVNQREERVLKFWDERGIFAKSLELRRGKKPFVFFEGPPTANAAPAIHHFIGRVFKDLICRYQTMRGRFVLRKGGWDTHGLPVELQVEKQLGFRNKKDIERYGIAAFNRLCRESVWQFKAEWERFTRRIGFWLDLHDPYVTYETPYIESLWRIISTIAGRKLLYRAHRVVPFCTRCGTPLSSHEVNLGYQTVTDTAVTLKFKVKSSKLKVGGKPLPKGTSILAWTTTPWTLPGNVALAVGTDIRYVLARRGEEHFLVAADLANKVLGTPLAIEAEYSGAQLVGIRYEPLFRVKALAKSSSYRVYPADFVTTTDGTGVVHTAVMYGEDDYRLGDTLGLVKRHTVTEQGTFTGVSRELDGKYVKAKETEDLILAHLEREGTLLSRAPCEHEYPFCWRCETPLLYYAKDSWFIRMSALNGALLANNDSVNWVPAHLKDGRFGQWLREGKDWAFSRERFWGTPLPIWMARNRHGKPDKTPLVISSLDDLDRYRADAPARLWVMRHGEATKNIDHIIDEGEGVSPLTEKGRAQVAAAAADLKQRLSAKRRKLAAIVSSPVQRTRETAELAAVGLGVKKVTYDDGLREIRFGPGLAGRHDRAYHERYPTYESKFAQRPEGGESLADLKQRIWKLLQRLNADYAGRDVLLVTHEYPIWMLHDVANGWSMAQSIAEKKDRGDDFVSFAKIEGLVSRNIPRDEGGNLDPHRPFIDDIVLKRGRTKLHRVPELCDVWFDSGAMPYAQWHWPFDTAQGKPFERTFKEQFPADCIAEGIDQTRGWFYTLLAVSTALGDGAPYRTVVSYSHVLDEKGQKMSKSKGNVVKPQDVFDAVGVDAARWYFYTVNNPGDPKMFSMRDVKERLTGFVGTLENCVRFWELGASDPSARSFSHGQTPSHLLDRWVFSRLHRLIGTATERLDRYDFTAAARAIESFVVEDLSQWWLRRSRKRSGTLGILRHVLLEVDKLIAPFTPFMAEDVHQRLHAPGEPGTESVHLHDWPAADAGLMDDGLESRMASVREWASAGLAVRKAEGVRVRQPLTSAQVPGPELPPDLEGLLCDELNVKTVRYAAGQPVSLDLNVTPALRAQGWVRETVRSIQDLRKEAGLAFGERATVRWHTDDAELGEALAAASDALSNETNSLLERGADTGTLKREREYEFEPGRKLWLGLR